MGKGLLCGGERRKRSMAPLRMHIVIITFNIMQVIAPAWQHPVSLEGLLLIDLKRLLTRLIMIFFSQNLKAMSGK